MGPDAVRAAATCRVSILRGTETNGYGDTVDSETAVRSGVPCSLIEQTRRVYLPDEGATRIIRSYAGRVGPETDLRKDDRIRNERNGRTYLVTDLGDPESAALDPDITFTASRTT